MEWQTIDSAPKDGTYVFAVIKGYVPSVARYQDGRWVYIDDEDCCELCWEAHLESLYLPTHWMPIPKVEE